MKKIGIITIIALFVLTLGISILYGQANKNSYINDVEYSDYLKNKDLKVRYYHYPFDEKYDLYGSADRVKNYTDLEKQSGIIAKVRLNSEFNRKIYYECVFSEIEVMKVYKGQVKAGQKISLFEPINCTGISDTLLCSEGYSPMVSGTEYLMFLKPVKNSLFGKDDKVYVPSTLTYSKFSLNDQPVKLFKKSELENGQNYSTVKGEDVYLYDKEMYEIYINIKNKVHLSI